MTWESGDERTRTADPLLAKQVLYQLSYVPEPTSKNTVSLGGAMLVAPHPVPIAVMRAWISAFSSVLCSRAFSTFKILPRIGTPAWPVATLGERLSLTPRSPVDPFRLLSQTPWTSANADHSSSPGRRHSSKTALPC